MEKKIIIIGAGLAGLSSGIYLQQQGFQTEIFESAPWAGGQCTAWFRKGYRFDGCIHWMVGTRKGDGIYKLYREVGALAEDTVIYNPPSVTMELGGVIYDVPLQEEKFGAYLRSIAPEDADAIDRFCADVMKMAKTKMAAGVPESLREKIAFLRESGGFLKIAAKYYNKTVGDVLSAFRSEKLKSILSMLMPSHFTAIALFMMLGTRIGGNAGYPMGGASGVISRMEAKYRGLGGKIRFNSKVDEIVVENGSATGIRCGKEYFPADGVVAACDAYDTLTRMLGGKYRHPQLEKMLKETGLFQPLAVVSFGLTKKFDIPYSLICECPEGIETAPSTRAHGFHLRAFDFDPQAAPEGGSSVMAMIEAPLEYWTALRQNDFQEYTRQKAFLAEVVKKEIGKRFTGFAEAVAVTDVSTPATYVRLTNVYRGSFEGFEATPAAMHTNIKKTFPEINNLLICGQWTTAGGGICTAINDGKRVAYFSSVKKSKHKKLK